MPDERTYGFSLRDANDLVNSIGSGESWYPEIKPRGAGGDGGVIEYRIIEVTTKETGPYAGLKAASAIVHGAPCNRASLIGEEIEVVDHSGGLFDEAGTMEGYTGWASEMVFLSLESGAECDDLTPCHWAAINRVCDPDTGIYAEPCEEEEEEEP